MVPDQFSHLLEEIHKLETELGHLPQKWKVLWDKLELPNTDSLAVSSITIFIKDYHALPLLLNIPNTLYCIVFYCIYSVL